MIELTLAGLRRDAHLIQAGGGSAALVIDQTAAARAGTLKVGKVTVDEQPRLAQLAGAQGIPFIVLYRDGHPAAHAIGAQPKLALERALGLGSRRRRGRLRPPATTPPRA